VRGVVSTVLQPGIFRCQAQLVLPQFTQPWDCVLGGIYSSEAKGVLFLCCLRHSLILPAYVALEYVNVLGRSLIVLICVLMI